LLNILGKRADGFHELETVMHPVRLFDELQFQRGSPSVELTCTDAALPTDSRNLVYRAATLFLETAQIREGVRLHLAKRIPVAAGLGGGSGNAACTLLGLTELFGNPLSAERLQELAGSLGSDVPFFLQNKPALATGRGEQVQQLGPFTALRGAFFLLAYPGFGMATAWAYQQLANFPKALNGQPGRAHRLVALLQTADIKTAGAEFYNSLEAPALHKFPLLELFREFFLAHGAAGALMSGSGSTTFAVFESQALAESALESFKSKFGPPYWLAIVPV
jgi:4-diphosphocytidyl-2-C-methyl-D-erythritol kinase